MGTISGGHFHEEFGSLTLLRYPYSWVPQLQLGVP